MRTAREQESFSVLVLRNKTVPIGPPCQQTQFDPLVDKGKLNILNLRFPRLIFRLLELPGS